VTRKPKPIRERESAASSAAQTPASAALARPDGRSPRQARPLKIERGVMPAAEGSALAIMGRTRVLCTATIEDRLPGWLRGKGGGWVTAEYGMLPRSTRERTPRAAQAGGRTHEIQRLIGRSLRAVTNLRAFGERTILLDCDVLEADAGTRTAAINGAFVALHDAFVKLSNAGHLAAPPLRDTVAAISVGIVGRVPCLDLTYAEDSQAQVDMNVVMTGSGRFVEVQGTGESTTFDAAELRALLSLARLGIRRVIALQRRLLGDSGLLPG
jgi:ribonuclease PH